MNPGNTGRHRESPYPGRTPGWTNVAREARITTAFFREGANNPLNWASHDLEQRLAQGQKYVNPYRDGSGEGPALNMGLVKPGPAGTSVLRGGNPSTPGFKFPEVLNSKLAMVGAMPGGGTGFGPPNLGLGNPGPLGLPPSPVITNPGISAETARARNGQPIMPMAGPTPELTAGIKKGKGLGVGAMPSSGQALA
jgi:hypothetical protein